MATCLGIFIIVAGGIGAHYLQAQAVKDNTDNVIKLQSQMRVVEDKLVLPRVGQAQIDLAVKVLGASLDKDIQALRERVDSQDEFKLQSIRIQTENASSLVQVKELLGEMKADIKKLNN